MQKVYIGEGDPVGPRLDSHARVKDFWTHAVVFTSRGQTLNKAHVQRLEAQLVERAKAAKRCHLDNGNTPQPPSLSEADTAEVDDFLEDVLLCLATLGYPFFEEAHLPVGSTPTLTTTLFLKSKGIQAEGMNTTNGFLVRKGSRATKSESPSCHDSLRDLRTTLVKEGVLRKEGDGYTITKDYTFSSPSTASGCLLGRSDNGRTSWKAADGRTLKDLQGIGSKE